MDLERALAEMAQGKLVQQRHARLEQLERWERAHKIKLRMRCRGDIWLRQAWLEQLRPFPNLGEVGNYDPRFNDTLLAECEDSTDYPTEAFVAQVALGIQALSSFDGVKEPEQQEKSEQAKHVIDWKKWASI